MKPEIGPILIKKSGIIVACLFFAAYELGMERFCPPSFQEPRASLIKLGIQRLNDGVRFSIMDIGIGFDVDRTLASRLKDRGMGLAYMEEQVRM